MTTRTPSPPSNMEVETLCFGGVFLLRGQDNWTTSNGQWTGPGHWSQQGHWKWVVDGYSSMTMTQSTRPWQQRSGSRRSTLRSWSGLASLLNLIPYKICGGSWRLKLPNISLKTSITWRESAKRSGTKSLLRCVQTWRPTTRNVWPLWLPTRVLPPSTKSCFAKGSNTYLTHSNANQLITSLKCNLSELFCCYSVSDC